MHLILRMRDRTGKSAFRNVSVVYFVSSKYLAEKSYNPNQNYFRNLPVQNHLLALVVVVGVAVAVHVVNVKTIHVMWGACSGIDLVQLRVRVHNPKNEMQVFQECTTHPS